MHAVLDVALRAWLESSQVYQGQLQHEYAPLVSLHRSGAANAHEEWAGQRFAAPHPPKYHGPGGRGDCAKSRQAQ